VNNPSEALGCISAESEKLRGQKDQQDTTEGEKSSIKPISRKDEFQIHSKYAIADTETEN
jgi:hypothetical protein